jgi:hypothetical protein
VSREREAATELRVTKEKKKLGFRLLVSVFNFSSYYLSRRLGVKKIIIKINGSGGSPATQPV